MNGDPGMIVELEGKHMVVKVPTGLGCTVCPTRSACTFRGPEEAYRTFRVPREPGYSVGDRVLVDEPGAVLGVTVLAVIFVPVVLLLSGYVLLSCCMRFPFATLLTWVVGAGLWFAVVYCADRWITHAPGFQARIRPGSPLGRSTTGH